MADGAPGVARGRNQEAAVLPVMRGPCEDANSRRGDKAASEELCVIQSHDSDHMIMNMCTYMYIYMYVHVVIYARHLTAAADTGAVGVGGRIKKLHPETPARSGRRGAGSGTGGETKRLQPEHCRHEGQGF